MFPIYEFSLDSKFSSHSALVYASKSHVARRPRWEYTGMEKNVEAY